MKDSTTFNFTKALIGDTILLEGGEMLIVQKFPTERRILLRPADKPNHSPRSISEFEFNQATPVLVRGKGKP